MFNILKHFLTIICLLSVSFFFTSCFEWEEPQNEEQVSHSTEETYFSIKQFFDDQWEIRKNDPVSLLRIFTLNSETDSVFVNLNDELWSQLRSFFDKADISHPKFLGSYEYNIFTDRDMQLVHIYFKAQDPNLTMRKMNISADDMTMLVKSVYIETETKKGFSSKSQKLLYIPGELIQIQEFEKAKGLPSKDLHISYYYPNYQDRN